MGRNNFFFGKGPQNDPFQSLAQGVMLGQHIVGNLNQAQTQDIKNQMLQGELDKQTAVKNAMANYGQPGFNPSEVIKADPALGLQLQNLIRAGNKDQIDMLSAAVKIATEYAPMLLKNPKLYPELAKNMEAIGIKNALPPFESFFDQSGNFKPNEYASTVAQIGGGTKALQDALKPVQPHFSTVTRPDGTTDLVATNPQTLQANVVPGASGSRSGAPVLWVSKTDPGKRQYLTPPQIPADPDMVPHSEQMKFQANEMDPAAIEMAATQYRITGQLPALGMGGAVVKSKILNRAAAQMAELNQGPIDPILAKTQLGAFKAELTQLQAQRGKVLAFADTAHGNIEQALKLSQQVDRTGIPVLNRFIQAGQKEVLGDPQMAAFAAANRVAINEIAKVTSSATGGQVTSDSARKEIEDTLKTAQTPEQYLAVVETLRQDMKNRVAGYDNQIARINEGIKKIGQVSGGSPEKTGTQTQPIGQTIPPTLLKQYYNETKQGIINNSKFTPEQKQKNLKELDDRYIQRGGQL